MKKYVLLFSGSMILTMSIHAGNGNAQKSPNETPQNDRMQRAMPDCSKLSVEEQHFANQLADRNNRSIFCLQFTPQQRQQAMQMMEQANASGGDTMSADQAVQQVIRTSPSQRKQGGACPMK